MYPILYFHLVNAYTVIPLSESALLLSFGNGIDLSVHEKVVSCKKQIEENPFTGFIETVPAYNSLAVYYNPLQIEKTEETIAATVEKIIANKLKTGIQSFNPSFPHSLITIPVCYDDEFGIDLNELSQTLELSKEEIIQLHSITTYKVFMTGFTPGFPYMGIMDEKLITKRKAQPRIKVDAGAVGIAGNQTGIYPSATPGGWNIIGRTPVKLVDTTKANPFLLKAGDEVKFEVITKEEFENYAPSTGLVGRESIINTIRPTRTSDEKNPIIYIEQCGYLSTLQDGGRKCYLQQGVSKGGAMDIYSAKLANILIGNDEDAAVLEITQSPHRFRLLKDTLVAFAGGGLQPEVSKQPVSLHQPLFIKKDSIIELKRQLPGFRLYMSVAGGFKALNFLNSTSTDLLIKAGGFEGRALKKEDTLESNASPTIMQQQLAAVLKTKTEFKFNLNELNLQSQTLRVMPGVEWNYLTTEAQQKIITTAFTVSPQSNRMGYRLKSETMLTAQSFDIISSPVIMGTVQLTSSGELIVLMADAQTVGGYPRVLQVIATDLPLLAQKKPGDLIQFVIVSLQEAEEAFLKQRSILENLKMKLNNMSV
jgi:KipI family sensor histidine kinase inhibitor